MALSDCVDCWETPCVCGTSYKNYSKQGCIELIEAILLGRKDKKEILKELTIEL